LPKRYGDGKSSIPMTARKPQLRDAHFVILGAIADHPGSTPADIAQRLGLDVDDVLPLLGDLDAAGMVTPGTA
jgi:DNA-binding MarR family transcriptional regulator